MFHIVFCKNLQEVGFLDDAASFVAWRRNRHFGFSDAGCNVSVASLSGEFQGGALSFLNLKRLTASNRICSTYSQNTKDRIQ